MPIRETAVMTIAVRPYDRDADFDPVGEMLVAAYRPGPTFRAWLRPRWEYMHFHPFIWGAPLDRCGVAEDGGEIVGVVHFEDNPAFTYLQALPGRTDVYEPLVAHAVDHLGGPSKTFDREVLGMYVHEDDTALQEIVAGHGFERAEGHGEPNARIDPSGPLHPAPLPDGFRLQSLADENDLSKVNAVLWRGFDHEGPPPDSELPGREFAQSAPNYRKDHTIVAVAPDGRYVSFGGMWVVPENRVGYVEPVATDPDFRRMGLGRAVVQETVRRAGRAGAEVVWVGSDQEFYRAIGFQVAFRFDLWVK